MKTFELRKRIPKRLKLLLIKLRTILGLILGLKVFNSPIGKLSNTFLSRGYSRSSFAQQGEDLILERIIVFTLKWNLNDSEKVYVDVGAYHPVDFSVTYSLYKRGWRGIVFDPSSLTKKQFLRWRKNDVFVNAIVGGSDESTVDFYFPKNSYGEQSLVGSKVPPKEEKSMFYNKKSFKQVSLNNELKRKGFDKIDFLNIDVEGAELEILKEFDFKTFCPSIVAVEIHARDLIEVISSKEAEILFKNDYVFIASAVITHFFVHREAITVN